MTKRAFVVFLFSFVLVSSVFATSIRKSDGVDFSLFLEVLDIIKKEHIFGEKIDKEKIIIEAVNGMLGSLDPHSRFLTAEEAVLDDMRTRGEFCGIGIVVMEDERGVFIDSVLEGSPAEKAGILPKDIIVCVDGDKTACFDLEDTLQKLLGTAGSLVRITIQRNFEAELSFEIKREVIELKTISFKKYNLGDRKIVVIKITQFTPNTYLGFLEAARDIKRYSPHGIIFDLRDNPGGLLCVVKDICESILGPGKIIYQEEFRRDRRETYLSRGRGMIFGKTPIALLVNKKSASASEIMTACLRDNVGSVVYGMRTFGKGSAQLPISLDSGKGTCVITVEKWLTPKGECIWGKGLIPDVVVRRRPSDVSGEFQLKSVIEKFVNTLKNSNR